MCGWASRAEHGFKREQPDIGAAAELKVGKREVGNASCKSKLLFFAPAHGDGRAAVAKVRLSTAY